MLVHRPNTAYYQASRLASMTNGAKSECFFCAKDVMTGFLNRALFMRPPRLRITPGLP